MSDLVKPLMIKELPQDERPREKLAAKGALALSNAELLAIILRTGTQQESVARLAERLLSENDGLSGLNRLTVQEMSKVKGIGAAKALTIVAAIELGRRIHSLQPAERPIIRRPEDIRDLMMPRLRYESKEHFVALLLSTKNNVLAQPVISVGSLNASLVHPRELFREAINYSAAAVVLVHNHPSGDPAPSKEDIELTRRMISAGELLGISVLDHVIIGDGKYVSFKEKGII